MSHPLNACWRTIGCHIRRQNALKLASGGVKVAVSARSADMLDKLAGSNANMVAVPVNVTSRDDVAGAVQRILGEFGALDLAMRNAGVWQSMHASAYDAGAATQSMAVNYPGIAHAL